MFGIALAEGRLHEDSNTDLCTMYALDAASGDTLWTFPSGGSVVAGAAMVDGTVYRGSGYGVRNIGRTPNDKLCAFEVQ